ncbi:MAG: hypothetical protein HRT61_20465 [Ekhidna sp.]|nr:hypothetical protein [Ekhidna sp.]
MKEYQQLSSAAFWLNVADFCEEMAGMTAQEMRDKQLDHPICTNIATRFGGSYYHNHEEWKDIMDAMKPIFKGMGYASGMWPIGRSKAWAEMNDTVAYGGIRTYTFETYWSDSQAGNRRRELALEIADYIRSSLGVQT